MGAPHVPILCLMDAIRELQRQLREAQKASNVKKISERNCIDLVQKLIDTGQVKLFHTANGKEWLTPEQLDREIRDALAGEGGRVGVTDLPGEVGVSIEHCEARVELMCKKDSSLRRLHGEILSGQYVQNVAQEIEESLEECGCLAVSDLAIRYNLPADFVRDDIIVRVDTPHVAKQNAIYTGAHAARVEARARGALRGCTLPVTLAQLAARHRLDADMLASAAQRMLKDGRILGKLQGSTFTPKVFSDAQTSKVDAFFDANQYLPLALAKSSSINVKEWALSKQIEGVTLHSAFLASQLMEAALASITEAVSSASWVDVLPLLPTSFISADARELVQHLTNKKRLPSGAVVMQHVVASSQFLQTVAARLEAEAKTAAERKLAAPSTGKTSKRLGAAGFAAPPTLEGGAAANEDDDGSQKKKGRRAGRGKKGKAEEEDGDCVGGDGGAGGAGYADLAIDNQVILDLLAEEFPDLPVDVHEDVCAQIQPLIAAMVVEAQNALRATLQGKRKNKFEQVEKLVQERHERLALGLRALETKDLVDSPLYQYLLRETVTESLHKLLALRWEEVSGDAMEVTSANRKQCLEQIVGKEGAGQTESLSRLMAALGGKGASKQDAKDLKAEKGVKEAKGSREARGGKETKGHKDSKGSKGAKDKVEADAEQEPGESGGDIVDLYHAAAVDCHILCRKVDKKREKAVLQEQRAERRDLLKEAVASDAMQVCTLGVQLCLLQDGVPGLLFPPEAWALRLVARSLVDESARDQAISLCDAAEESDDKVALEAAAVSWRERVLGGGK